MKMIVLGRCGNGYQGYNTEDIFFFKENTTQEEISDELQAWACDHEESYFHAHSDCNEDCFVVDWDVIAYEAYQEWCEKNGYDSRDYEDLYKED